MEEPRICGPPATGPARRAPRSQGMDPARYGAACGGARYEPMPETITEPAPGPARIFENSIPFAPVARLIVPDEFKAKELAWKLSVQGDNPVLLIPRRPDLDDGALPPTGFEPYFVGSPLAPKEILVSIAEIGAQQLDHLARQHQEDESYVARLLSILRTGRIAATGPQRTRDLQSLAQLDALLGSLTRSLGYQAESDEEGRRYRQDTHRLTDPFVHTLTYTVPDEGAIRESYKLPDVSRAQGAIAPEWRDLPTYRLRRGWRFMALLGDRLGNAPVRAGLQDRWQLLPIQYRYC